MYLEVPRFQSSIVEDQVIVTAEQQAIEPAVLFEMLGGTTIRIYNINTPKEENIYLRPIAARPNARGAMSELDPYETHSRVQSLLTEFSTLSEDLLAISDGQFQALVDHGRLRARHQR